LNFCDGFVLDAMVDALLRLAAISCGVSDSRKGGRADPIC
jgi:hypothetical protein